jgi:flagellar biosynthesis/type III secretory pathway ATPase
LPENIEKIEEFEEVRRSVSVGCTSRQSTLKRNKAEFAPMAGN